MRVTAAHRMTAHKTVLKLLALPRRSDLLRSLSLRERAGVRVSPLTGCRRNKTVLNYLSFPRTLTYLALSPSGRGATRGEVPSLAGCTRNKTVLNYLVAPRWWTYWLPLPPGGGAG